MRLAVGHLVYRVGPSLASGAPRAACLLPWEPHEYHSSSLGELASLGTEDVSRSTKEAHPKWRCGRWESGALVWG